MITLTLTVTESDQKWEVSRPTLPAAILALCQEVLLACDFLSPALLRACADALEGADSREGVWGEEVDVYTSEDFSVPEENFRLEVRGS